MPRAAHRCVRRRRPCRRRAARAARAPPLRFRALLRAHGFSGTDAAVVSAAAREAPHLLAQASSASSMWTAN
ncbi:MAG: N-succinylarginine dihydrolase, partial [Phycisphaerales bacterium]